MYQTQQGIASHGEVLLDLQVHVQMRHALRGNARETGETDKTCEIVLGNLQETIEAHRRTDKGSAI